MFQSVARCSIIRLSKPILLLAVAHWCGLLHRRWRQRGVNLAAADTFFALFTGLPRRGILRTSPVGRSRKFRLLGGRGRDGWRLHVVVDARRRKQPAAPALVDSDARLGWDVGYPQRTQLYSMVQRTPSSVSVQCSSVMPPPLANMCVYSSRKPSAPRWRYAPPLGSRA